MRRSKQHPRWSAPAGIGALLIAGILLLAITPARADGSDRTGGDGLRDAAKEARKSDGKKRVLAAGTPREGQDCGGPPWWTAWFESSEDYRPREPRRHRLLEGWQVGTVANGVLGGSTLRPTGEYGLRVGWTPSPRLALDAQVLGGGRGLSAASGVVGAFDAPSELSLDLSARYRPDRDAWSLGLEPLAGVSFDVVSWSYHEPILVSDAGPAQRVRDDDLSAVSPYLGVALPLVDTRRVRLGLALKAGVSFYGRHTDAGLRNDLFPTTGFARLQIETAFPL